MKRVLIAPGAEEGRGGGHLVRAGTLALELRELGVAAFLCLERPFSRETGRYRQKIPSTLNSGFARSVLAPLGIGEELILPAAECIEKKNAWDLIILDRFRTPPEEYRHWAAAAPVLGIDEGGPLRSSFDFLLDLLPRTETKRPPNWVGPELLRLPEKRRPSFNAWAKPGKFRVLVSFGAEDSAGLALASARILSGLGKESCVEIDLVSPGEAVIPPPIRHRKFVPRLREELASYDLALTHFGLTCFEALYARLPVLLLSPTAYHEKLCKSAALPSLGTGKKGLAALERLCRKIRRAGSGTDNKASRPYADGPDNGSSCNGGPDNGNSCNGGPDNPGGPYASGPDNGASGGLYSAFLNPLREQCAAAARRHGLEAEAEITLGQFIAGLAPVGADAPAGKRSGGFACPVCGPRKPGADSSCADSGHLHAGRRAKTPPPALGRFSGRSYRRCPECGTVYMDRSAPPPVVYEKSYFFEAYKKQYGKTYLEDFPHLKELARGRLAAIQKLLSPASSTKRPRLLDIGCAYGPFLAAARDEGFDCLGMDPAEDAVRYVKEKLGIPAVQGCFPEAAPAPGDEGFDVISLWYVIEHLAEPGKALDAIASLLKPGGVLALSTPSFSGVTGRFRQQRFLSQSPEDHWIIWEPSILKKIFGSHGIELKKIIVNGHHPERFPLIGKRLEKTSGPLYGFVKKLSVVFGLGDGFEAYGRKRGNL